MNCRRTLNDCVSSLTHSPELFVAAFASVRQPSFTTHKHFDITVLASECLVSFYPSVYFAVLSRELFEKVFRFLFAYIELIRKRTMSCTVHGREYSRFHHFSVNRT